jgi:hypothetical protein
MGTSGHFKKLERMPKGGFCERTNQIPGQFSGQVFDPWVKMENCSYV